MDALTDIELSLMKFGVGQPVPRKEDPTLLRGEGRYTDDINLAGQAYAVMVRSRQAHGILKGIDVAEAKAKLEAAGVEVNEMWDSGVCHGAGVRDPDGNPILLHNRYKPYEET